MQGIVGGALGAITGLVNIWAQKRQQDRDRRLAQKQFEAARDASITEEQARAKANAKEPDVDAILDSNEIQGRRTDLTKGRVKTRLFKPVGKLGGANDD